MRHIRLILSLAAIFAIQPVFADVVDDSDTKPCKSIAKACLSAGFVKHDKGSKNFWKDCMKIALMDKTVEGVKIDKATADACRADKINKMQDELKDLQSVK